MSLKMFVFLVRLLWLVWWTIPMTRMKKMTTKKSSLRGSGLAWVLKADCSDFLVRVNRFGPVLPPLVGSLGHVPFFSLSEETVKAEGSCITAPPPPKPLLFFFSGRGGETLLETTCYSLSISYRPLTKITIYPEFFAISPPPQMYSAFPVLIFFEAVLSSPPSPLCWPVSSCWKQQRYGGSQRFSVAIATGARKLYDGDPAGTIASSLALSLSMLLEPELMSSRDGGKPRTSQCTNCCAGQSG